MLTHFIDADTNAEYVDMLRYIERGPAVGEEIEYWVENPEDRDSSETRCFVVTRIRHFYEVRHSPERETGKLTQELCVWIREVPDFEDIL